MLQNQKTELKHLQQDFTLLFWVKVLLLPKNADFLQTILTSAKLRGPW